MAGLPGNSRPAETTSRAESKGSTLLSNTVALLDEVIDELSDYDDSVLAPDLRRLKNFLREAVETFEAAPRADTGLEALNTCKDLVDSIVKLHTGSSGWFAGLDAVKPVSRDNIIAACLAITAFVAVSIALGSIAHWYGQSETACYFGALALLGTAAGIGAAVKSRHAIGRHVSALRGPGHARQAGMQSGASRIADRMKDAAVRDEQGIRQRYDELLGIGEVADADLPVRLFEFASRNQGNGLGNAALAAFLLFVSNWDDAIQKALACVATSSASTREAATDSLMKLLRESQCADSADALVKWAQEEAIRRWHTSNGDDKTFFEKLARQISPLASDRTESTTFENASDQTESTTFENASDQEKKAFQCQILGKYHYLAACIVAGYRPVRFAGDPGETVDALLAFAKAVLLVPEETLERSKSAVTELATALREL